ncbi:MAG: hypothetical protein VW378_06665 [bacterium]
MKFSAWILFFLRKNFIFFLFFLSSFSSFLFAQSYTTPTIVHLELNLSFSDEGSLNKEYRVRISVGSLNEATPPQFIPVLDGAYFENSMKQFNLGHASFTLDFASFGDSGVNLLDVLYRVSNPYFRVQVAEVGKEFGDDFVVFPFPSTPYALQARVAERVRFLDASVIHGDFTQALELQGGLRVTGDGQTQLYVTTNFVGIGTDQVNTDYVLDVSGNLNVLNLYKNGEPLKNNVSPWTIDGDLVFLENKRVGVGVDVPRSDYMLDVSGNMNVSSLYIGGVALPQYLVEQRHVFWQFDQTGDRLYLDGAFGDVVAGIGFTLETSANITEALTVSGGVRLGKSVQTTPLPGTLSYEDGRFYGYISSGRFDLVGPQVIGQPVANQLAYWASSDSLTGTNNLFIDPLTGFLGVGTEHPSASLHVVAQAGSDSDLLRIEGADGAQFMIVNDEGKMGLGKQPSFHLDVNGAVNATQYYQGGVSLLQAISEASAFSSTSVLWQVAPYFSEDPNRQISLMQLYYNMGFVGIGTSSPNALLELHGEDAVALVFNQANQGAFIMGVPDDSPNDFVISTGTSFSNSENYLMKFSVNENSFKLGLGVSDPKAGLHIRGKSGFMIEGISENPQNVDVTGMEGSMLLYSVSKKAFVAASRSSWNNSHFGEGAVLLGQQNTAAGVGAAVLGGLNNEASGNYSLVPGGFNNKALANYSFAGGRHAKVEQNAVGSFVWSDAAILGNGLTSDSPGQFLISSQGGVGINTNQTAGSVLTVKGHFTQTDSDNLLKFQSQSAHPRLVLKNNGNLGLNTASPRTTLDVSGNMRIGTSNRAIDAIFYVEGSDDHNVFEVRDNSGQPVFIVDADGQVGIGLEDPQYALHVSGNIFADSYTFLNGGSARDLDDLIIWQTVQSSLGKDIFYNRGRVGIGTSNPVALLHLAATSNINSLLTFSQNNHFMSMGFVTENNQPLFVIVASANESIELNDLAENQFIMSISGNSVGIGTRTPSGALTVSGASYFQGPVVVGDDTFYQQVQEKQTHSLYVKDLVVENLYYQGDVLEYNPSSSWLVDGGDVLFTTHNVLIGTVNEFVVDPGFSLFVTGTLVASIVSADVINTVFPALEVGDIYFSTENDGDEAKRLYVQGNRLMFDGTQLNTDLNFMNEFSPTASGSLAFFVTDSTKILRAPVYFDHSKKLLTSTANLAISRVITDNEAFVVTQNVFFGFSSPDNSAFHIDSTVDTGQPGNTFSHTAMDIDINLLNAWDTNQTLVGFDLSFLSDVTNFRDIDVVGLLVSINPVAAQQHKVFSAVFNGGPVMIGYSQDNLTVFDYDVNSDIRLYVNGSVSTNALIANDARISLQQLESQGLKVANGRIGIGFQDTDLNSDFAFQVSGNVHILQDLKVDTLFVSDNLTVGDIFSIQATSGMFVIGTSLNGDTFVPSEVYPTTSLLISKSITLEDTSYIGQNLSILFDRDLSNVSGVDVSMDFPDGAVVNSDVTGIKLAFESAAGTFVTGSVKGLVVSMNDITLDDTANDARLIGVHVDMTQSDLTRVSGNRYSAVFMGGHVGIGLDDPQESLHVSGTVKADEFIVGSWEVTTLNVSQNFTAEDVSINRAEFTNLLVNNFDVGTFISDQFVTVDIATDLDFITANRMSVNYLQVMDSIEISDFKSNVLTVNGTAFIHHLNLPDSHELVTMDRLMIGEALTLNVGASFVVSQNDDIVMAVGNNRVGIGVDAEVPSASLHIVSANVPAFNFSDPDTWAVFRVDGQIQNSNFPFGFGLMFQPTDNASMAGLVSVREDDTSSLRFIVSSNTVPKEIMSLSPQGLGIGTTDPGAALHVSGDVWVSGLVTVNHMHVENLVVSGNTGVLLSIGDQLNRSYQVSSDGRIVVSANVDAISVNDPYIFNDMRFTLDLATETALSDVNGTLSEVQATYPNAVLRNGVFYDRNPSNLSNDIIGISMMVSSNPGAIADGSVVKGFDMDLSDVIAEEVIGLYIDVTNPDVNSLSSRRAAIFKGRVGIGVERPSADLHVHGTVSANQFVFDTALVTVNELTLEQVLTLNTLVLDTNEQNKFFVNELRVSTLNVEVLTANRFTLLNTLSAVTINAELATFNQTMVGFNGTEMPLFLPTISMYVSGNVSVNGTIFAEGLEVSGILGTVALPDIENELTLNRLIVNRISVNSVLSANVFSFNDVGAGSMGQPLDMIPATHYMMLYSGGLRYFSPGHTDGQDLLGPFGSQDGVSSVDGSLIYFDEGLNQFRSFSSLRWNSTSNRLEIGSTTATLNQIVLNTVVSNQSNQNLIEGVSLNFIVSRDLTGSGSSVVYKGLDISFDSYPSDASSFLGVNESAVGLFVDVRSQANHIDDSGFNRYAAVFQGGLVGIGTETPTALLHIIQDDSFVDTRPLLLLENQANQSIFSVYNDQVFLNTTPEDAANQDALMVIRAEGDQPAMDVFSDNGMVLKITSQSVDIGVTLDVLGTVVVDEVSVNAKMVAESIETNYLNLVAEITTIDMLGQVPLSINYVFNAGSNTGQSNSFVGFDLMLSADTSDATAQNFPSYLEVPELVDGSFYGLRVEMDESVDSSSFSNRYFSAGFFGAPVLVSALGDSSDAMTVLGDAFKSSALNLVAPLYVGEVDSVARMMTVYQDVNNQLLFNGKSFDSTRKYFNFSLHDSSSGERSALLMANTDSGPVIGVGHGVENFIYNDAAAAIVNSGLYVSGNFALRDSGLVFPSGNQIRVSSDSQTSELVVSVNQFSVRDQDNPEREFFKMGPHDTGSDLVRSFFQVGKKVDLDSINLKDSKALFTIKGFFDDNIVAADLAQYVTLIEVKSGKKAMAISLPSDSDIQSSFVEFQYGSNPAGAIKSSGSSSGGVFYETKGADYAEYLPKKYKDEVINKGDIVGVFNGYISKKTEGAQLLMVISSTPAVAGNMPGEDAEDYALVSFLGQVRVKVFGSVSAGDYILSSGKGDGIGRAVSPDHLEVSDYGQVVGTSWESSSDDGLAYINVAVGAQFSLISNDHQRASLSDFQNELSEVKQELNDLQSKLKKLLDDYDAKQSSQKQP